MYLFCFVLIFLLLISSQYFERYFKSSDFHTYILMKRLVFEIFFQYWHCIFFLQNISNHLKLNQKNENKLFMLYQKLRGTGTCCGNIQLLFCLESGEVFKFWWDKKFHIQKEPGPWILRDKFHWSNQIFCSNHCESDFFPSYNPDKSAILGYSKHIRVAYFFSLLTFFFDFVFMCIISLMTSSSGKNNKWSNWELSWKSMSDDK